MAERQTEKRHDGSLGLDLLAPEAVLRQLVDGQVAAAAAVESALSEIAAASEMAAGCVEAGGRLVYAAAGSSGLMALADALELPGTFGVPRHQVVVLLAGGQEALVDLRGGPEDDEAGGRDAAQALGLGPKDCIIAVTASGQTPYPLAVARVARAAGARRIGIANNRDAALFETVDVAVHLPTPPEVVAGSTRMGAGTAQKIALNMMSTLMAIRLGHVHDGFMVNVVADNAKLRARARGIVAAIAGVGDEAAAEALSRSEGMVKDAVLLAAGVDTPGDARAMLGRHGGKLRSALAEVAGAANKEGLR